MGDPGGFADPPPRCGSGTITRIRLENFMCHSHLEIELGPYVNFITGQNGSGKSAILTALCIAFGCRAKGTQRASSLKDFIKTGCSYALVEVEVKNEGDDAFERETYGDAIIIERRITDSSSSLVLKDNRGKKVATTRDELRKLVDHFNIDVENPCVVMSQDKSREFLHSGSEKDKFKFFFKGTLLQLVKDLLLSIDEQLESANALVDDLESSIKPIEKELCELQEKIKNLELIEDLSQQVQQLKKKLAWAWVYDVDRQLQEQMLKIEKLKDRIPTCQAKIDWESGNVESLRDLFKKKKAQTEEMVQRTQEVRRNQNELQNSVTMATKKKLEIEGKHRFGTSQLRKMVNHAKSLEEQARDIHEQQLRSTQAEESEMEEKLRELQHLVDAATDIHLRLEEEERVLLERQSQEQNEMTKIMNEIEYYRKKEHDLQSSIRDCRSHQTNKVTAFGGNRVINLLQTIERHHQKFHKPPIGPIGAHVTLANGDTWAPPVENAIGKLLNAFIVTDHSDSMLLRRCAREARYDRLQIIIYDFSRPRLNIPSHLLPRTDHPSTLSVLRSDSDTVLNVLIDVGHAERQILVKDYESGKSVAFDRRVSNVKEVFTLDGYKMFLRGTVETTLPPNKNLRTGRLCASYDGQIADLEQELSRLEKEVEECRKKKRHFEANLQSISSSLRTVKERRINAQRELSHKKRALEDRQKSHASNISAGSSVGEMYQEIESIREEIKEKEIILEAHQKELVEAEARVKDLRESLESLCESAREEINTLEEAEHEIMKIEKALKAAEGQKAHYEGVMNNKVLPDIKAAEAQYQDLEDMRKESYKKASIICPESEIEALGEWDGSTPDKLSALLKRLKDRLQKESQRCSDSIDDLRMLYNKKERKILRKRQAYQNFREKLKACKHALFLRQSKFKRNAALLKRQLTWGFNNLLGKKGISGTIKVDYEKQTLKIEVKMPQDASGSNVRDTKGLSGGERSFSTLCFTLGLHQMIEAPFRAMDEFDVFMDAVSRKISLDTLVDYALQQGSQWIFITPHDISMVKQDPKIKKQQMAAPRS